MIVENALRCIEKLENGLVGDGVIHVAAGFPAGHNIAHSQNRQLLGHVRLLNLQSFAELIHAFLAIAKAVEDLNSDRVGEGFEKLGFEVGDLLWHGILPYKYILICEYSHVKQVDGPARELPRRQLAPVRGL